MEKEKEDLKSLVKELSDFSLSDDFDVDTKTDIAKVLWLVSLSVCYLTVISCFSSRRCNQQLRFWSNQSKRGWGWRNCTPGPCSKLLQAAMPRLFGQFWPVPRTSDSVQRRTLTIPTTKIASRLRCGLTPENNSVSQRTLALARIHQDRTLKSHLFRVEDSL